MKRLIPFWVWMRRNAPHMVSVLFTNPRKVTSVGHLIESAKATNPVDNTIMPDWMRNTTAIPLPIKDRAGNTMMMPVEGILPVGDIEKMLAPIAAPKEFPREAMTSLSPLLKTPLELITNRDLYYGNEVSRFTGDTRRAPGYIEKFDDIAANVPGLKEVWSGVKKSLGIVERKDKSTGEPYLAMNAYAVKAIKDLNPWFNAVGKMMADDPKAGADTFSYMTGIRLTPYQADKFLSDKLWADNTALQEALKKARDEGAVAPANQKKPKSLSQLLGGK